MTDGAAKGGLSRSAHLPIWILRSPDFVLLRRASPLALRVLLCLWAHGSGYGSTVRPGEKRLAALCKTSVPSVSQAIKLLELAKWVEVRRQRQQGQGNVYRLVVPPTLTVTATRVQSWLAAPSWGKDAAPTEGALVQVGDLWGDKGKGRRRCRIARVSLAGMNADTWDLLWRTDSVAGHLWMLLQAYGPSGEETSLSRLGRELGVRPSAISAGLAKLRELGMLTGSVRQGAGTVHTVVEPEGVTELGAGGAIERPGRGRMRRALDRTADGRWVHTDRSRPRRVMVAPGLRRPAVRGPAARPLPSPAVAAPPPAAPRRWCVAHGALQSFVVYDPRYGGTLACGCGWSRGHHDQVPDPRRPADYAPL